MKKILSIIIPTYNMEDYIEKCLNSLIVPKIESLEVLIINDGSKDYSSLIAHKFAEKYPELFRVIDKENGNYGSCINVGIKIANGKYVKILDADDSFNNKYLIEYLDAIKKVDADIILNDVHIVNLSDEITGRWTLSSPHQTLFHFFSRYIFPEMHMVAYKTEKLRQIAYNQTEGISYTDQEWVFEPMTIIRRAYYLPIPLYRYLLGREGQTVDPKVSYKNMSQRITVLEKMLNILTNTNHSEEYYDWMVKKFFIKCRRIYEVMILQKACEDSNLIVAFDLYFKKKSPTLYHISGETFIINRMIRYKYVKHWRKKYSLSNHNIAFLLYSTLKKLRGK